MNRCIECNTDQGIIHSGVDAFMLGVLDKIEKICYDCALTLRNKVST